MENKLDNNSKNDDVKLVIHGMAIHEGLSASRVRDELTLKCNLRFQLFDYSLPGSTLFVYADN